MQTLIDILTLGARLLPIWFFFALSFALGQMLGWKKIIRDDFAILWSVAAVATGVMFVAMTELTSAVNQLTPSVCRSGWICADFVLLAVLITAAKKNWRECKVALAALPGRWRAAMGTRIAQALLIASAVFLLAVGVFAVETPTTVWDCQTYHMPRIMHWLQQRNLDDYATNIPRQVEYPPGAEMTIAQLMLLSGNDLPANLPQWWAWLTSALLAGFLTREMLAAKPWRKGTTQPVAAELCATLAVVLAVTTPGAAKEAISSLNNILAGMWCLAAILFGWLVLQNRQNYYYHFGCGAAVALGICVKHSTFIYLAPFVVLVAVELARKRFFGTLLKLGFVSLVLVCALNGRWMLRNSRQLGNPLISTAVFSANTRHSISPAKITANLLRNLSFYTRTPFQSVTTDFNTVLEFLGELIHEPLDDPAAVFQDQRFQFPPQSDFSDGSALGNCYPGLLLILAGLGFIKRGKALSAPTIYALALAASFILFSALLIWDPWHTRLEFDYFIFAAPFTAVVIGSWFNRWAVAGIAAFLLLNASLGMVSDLTLPTLAATFHTQPREELYFAVRRELAPSTIALADDIKASGCTNVLLKIGNDTWEYPIWALLKERGFTGTINHTLVENQTAAAQPSTSLDWPRTVLLTIHANEAPIPAAFGLVVDYEPWKAYYKSALAEERVRVIQNRAVVKYTLARSGRLTVAFEPRDASGNPATNGSLNLTVEHVDTNTFEVSRILNTNLTLTTATRFSIPVPAGGATIFLTNAAPANPIAWLYKLEVEEEVGP